MVKVLVLDRVGQYVSACKITNLCLPVTICDTLVNRQTRRLTDVVGTAYNYD